MHTYIAYITDKINICSDLLSRDQVLKALSPPGQATYTQKLIFVLTSSRGIRYPRLYGSTPTWTGNLHPYPRN